MKRITITLLISILFSGLSAQNLAYDYIDIGKVKARFFPVGNQFSIPPADTLNPLGFEVPKDSNTATIHNCALWIGGIDPNNMLKFAGETFRNNGEDYWPGPISSVYDSLYDIKWNHIWKINKSTIDDFKVNWANTSYTIPQIIIDWPAHGNIIQNQAYNLAPFFDYDNDGNYIPQNGDYPLIRGDQALFFIFNDARNPHTESGGLNLGIEVHGMAYAFNCPGDTLWEHTVFLNYKIFNRSTLNLSNTYLGIYSDIDIGGEWDDYIECDIANGMYFAFNADSSDSIYGNNPPVQAIQFLGGPFLNPDAIDNPKFDTNNIQLCNESINGLNFGDSIIDNERYGLRGFMAIWPDIPGVLPAISDPNLLSDYTKMLKLLWKDGTIMQYGGNAHPSSASYGPDCRYMYPGYTDPCNWGTGGLPPNGAVFWTEQTAGNQPFERRGLGTCGPFDFPAGSMHEMDIAFIYARSDSGINASIDSISAYGERVKLAFTNNLVPCSGANISDTYYIVDQTKEIQLYPNPSSNFIHIDFAEIIYKAEIEIFNLMGELIISREYSNLSTKKINIEQLQSGLYLIRINMNGSAATFKFIKK